MQVGKEAGISEQGHLTHCTLGAENAYAWLLSENEGSDEDMQKPWR